VTTIGISAVTPRGRVADSRTVVEEVRSERTLEELWELNAQELARDKRARRRARTVEQIGFLAFGALLFGGWEWAARSGIIHPSVAPAPTEILAHLPTLVTAEYFPRHLSVTLQELAIGFTLGIISGVLLGTVVAVSEFGRSVIQPYVIALHAPPKVLLAPLFITWFGFGMGSKIVVAVVIAFFPLFVNTVTGLSSIHGDADRLMSSLTASRSQMFFKVRLPNALPLVASGVKMCWTLAVTGVIVAEFIGAQAGLGFLLNSFNFQLDILGVYSLIVLMAVSTVVVYWVLEALERRYIFWERL
jgi:NitT/TauT family transport system permease protein